MLIESATPFYFTPSQKKSVMALADIMIITPIAHGTNVLNTCIPPPFWKPATASIPIIMSAMIQTISTHDDVNIARNCSENESSASIPDDSADTANVGDKATKATIASISASFQLMLRLSLFSARTVLNCFSIRTHLDRIIFFLMILLTLTIQNADDIHIFKNLILNFINTILKT